ncbi:unnamed protein product [Mucor fragilis]
MSQESAVNYTVPSNVDCSSYFKSRPLQQWNRDDYVSYRRENGSSSLPDGKLIEDYNCEFTKLLASKDIPDESKRAMKSMQPMANRKRKQKSAINNYNTYSQCALSKSGNASITFGETATKVLSDSQDATNVPSSSIPIAVMGSSMSESEPVDNSSTTSYPPQSNHRPIDELFEDEPLPDTVPNDFRDAVFKAGYHYFKGELSLDTIASLTHMKQGFIPTTLNEYLDVLSYNLLMKDMGPDEKNTLKLSLCHIVSFVGATAVVYDNFFSRQDPEIKSLYEAARLNVPKLPTGLTDKAKEIIDELVTIASEDEDRFELKLVEKKLEALKGPRESQELQIFSIVEYVASSLIRSDQRRNSELSCYRITAFIIELVLGKSPLKIIE